MLQLKHQNKVLLVASYIFYAAWDWRYLSLIMLSTLVDYYCGNKIYNTHVSLRRRLFLVLSVTFNLGMLGFFKYFNFFIDNMLGLTSLLGLDINPLIPAIILPVGISFTHFKP